LQEKLTEWLCFLDEHWHNQRPRAATSFGNLQVASECTVQRSSEPRTVKRVVHRTQHGSAGGDLLSAHGASWLAQGAREQTLTLKDVRYAVWRERASAEQGALKWAEYWRPSIFSESRRKHCTANGVQ
jgi:hypothetical protein